MRAAANAAGEAAAAAGSSGSRCGRCGGRGFAKAAAAAAWGACGHCGSTAPGPSAGKGVWCSACRVQWYCKLACANKARKTHRTTEPCVGRAAARLAAAGNPGAAASPQLATVGPGPSQSNGASES